MAVDNFVQFKRLMVKRNTELNQQCLAMEKVAEAEAQPKDTTSAKKEAPKEAGKKDNAKKESAPKEAAVPKDEAMKEALKVAQELERMEEEEMMRRAIEESQKME